MRIENFPGKSANYIGYIVEDQIYKLEGYDMDNPLKKGELFTALTFNPKNPNSVVDFEKLRLFTGQIVSLLIIESDVSKLDGGKKTQHMFCTTTRVEKDKNGQNVRTSQTIDVRKS